MREMALGQFLLSANPEKITDIMRISWVRKGGELLLRGMQAGSRLSSEDKTKHEIATNLNKKEDCVPITYFPSDRDITEPLATPKYFLPTN